MTHFASPAQSIATTHQHIAGSSRQRSTLRALTARAVAGISALLLMLINVTTLSATSIEASSFLAGAGAESVRAVGTDAAGNIYIAGTTMTGTFPQVGGSLQPGGYAGGSNPVYGIQGGRETFIAKISASGNQLLAYRYLGGTDNEYIVGMVVHPDGSLTVIGQTWSTNFPQTISPIAAAGAFITRISAEGSIVYSRVFAGANAKSIDAYTGNDVLIGLASTNSTPLTVTAGMRAKTGSDFEGYIALISETGAITRGSFTKVNGSDAGSFLAKADNAGNVYMTGKTTLTALGSPFGFSQGLSGADDLFKLSADWSTVEYHCGVGYAGSFPNLTIDRVTGAAFVFGIGTFDTHPWNSSPSDRGAYQANWGYGGVNGYNIHITKVRPDGKGRDYATWFGAAQHFGPTVGTPVVDSAGRLIFTSGGDAWQVPTVNGLNAPSVLSSNGVEATSGLYVARMRADGQGIDFGGYLTVDGICSPGPVALDPNGKLIVTGNARTTSTFTLVNPIQSDLGGTERTPMFARLNLTASLPTVSAKFLTSSVTEGGTATFRLTRTGATTNPLTVYVDYRGDTRNGSDFNLLANELTIPAGQASLDVPVVTIDDGIKEINEKLYVVIQRGGLTYDVSAPAGDNPRNASAVLTINDVNASGKIGITVDSGSETSVNEGSTGVFKLLRSGDTSAALTISFTLGGTATRPADYRLNGTTGFPEPTTITFPAGIDFALLYIFTETDALVEGTESVSLLIPTTSTYQFVGSIPVMNIIDANSNPSLPTVSITTGDASADARTGDPASFTVARTGSTASPLTVSVAFGGVAVNGVDYQALATSVTIPAGQSSATTSIVPIRDTPTEGNENLTVSLVENGALYNMPPVLTFPSLRNVTITIFDDAYVGTPDPIPQGSEITVRRGTTNIATGSTDAVGAATILNYVIYNEGAAPLEIIGMPASITGTNCTMTISPSGLNTIPVGGNATYLVTVTPSGPSVTWSGALAFTTNDVNELNYTWTMSGTAVASPAQVTVKRGAAAIADGATDTVSGTVVATGKSLAYTIENQGGSNLTLGAFAVGAQTNCTVTIDAQPAVSVLPSLTSSLSVTVTPTAAGAWSFTLSGATNVAGKNPYNWTVNGTATAGPGPVNGPGDVNGDRVVNASDFAAVAAKFGLTSASPGWDPMVDTNSDGVINATDFANVAANFGKIY